MSKKKTPLKSKVAYLLSTSFKIIHNIRFKLDENSVINCLMYGHEMYWLLTVDLTRHLWLYSNFIFNWNHCILFHCCGTTTTFVCFIGAQLSATSKNKNIKVYFLPSNLEWGGNFDTNLWTTISTLKAFYREETLQNSAKEFQIGCWRKLENNCLKRYTFLFMCGFFF